MSRAPGQNVDAAAAQPDDRPPSLASWYTPGLSDALGDRLLMCDNVSATGLELLRFKSEFSEVPAFEAALRDRVRELAGFEHPALANVRAVEWLGEGEGLALVSNQVVGRRLSDVLSDARGAEFAASLIRQLMPVLDALEAQGDGIAHGLITPERIIITPEGRLVLVEHVVGAAVAALKLPPERLASEFGLSDPPARDAGASSDDVARLGHIALRLLTGLEDAAANARLLLRNAEAPEYLRRWIERAVGLSPAGFASARDAHRVLANWPAPESALPTRKPVGLLDLRTPTLADDIPRWPTPPPIETTRRPAKRVDFSEARRAKPVIEPPVIEPPASAQVQVIEPPVIVEPAAERPAVAAPVAEPRGTEQPVIALDRRVPETGKALFRTTLDSDFPSEVETDDSRIAADPPRGINIHLTIGHWAVVALAVVAVLEGIVIVGLLLTRPTGVSPEPAAKPAAASAPTTRPPTTGRLEITARPPGARVTVDGQLRGTSPLSLVLPVGKHDVTIAIGNRTLSQSVDITGGQPTVISPR